MGLRFNPLTFASLDFDSAATATSWKAPVADSSSLPTTGNADGDARVTLDTDEVWVWDANTSRWENQQTQVTSGIGSTPNSQGYSIEENESVADLRTNDLVLQPADSSNPGIVSTASQNFAGNKTFDDNIIVTGDLTVNGTTTTVNTTTTTITDPNIVLNDGGDQSSANTNVSGFTVEMSDATDAILGYDSTLTSKFKLGEIGSEDEIAGVTFAQTLENKTIDATAATGNNTVSMDAVDVVYDNASSGLAATDVQNAVDELSDEKVDGPASSTDNAIVRYDGISGKLVQDSSVLIDDSDAVTGITQLTVDNVDINGNTVSSTSGNLILDPTDDINFNSNNVINSGNIDPSGDNADNLGSDDASVWNTLRVRRILNSTQPELFITTSSQTSGSTDSFDIETRTGNVLNTATASSGQLILRTGQNSSSNGTGTGAITIASGDGFGATQDSGDVTIESGTATGNRGNILLDAGNISLDASSFLDPATDQSGRIGGTNRWSRITASDRVVANQQLTTGSAASTSTIGRIRGGSATSDEGTTVFYEIKNVNASSTQSENSIFFGTDTQSSTRNSGDVVVESGNTVDGDSGDIIFYVGTPSGTGTRGDISLKATQINANSSKIINVTDPTNDQDVATKKYVDDNTSFVTGDLDETTATILNNQSSAVDVTGLAFANGTTRSAIVQYHVFIDATADLYESGQLFLVQKGASWDLSQTSNGDNSQVVFSITSTGQVQYTSPSYAGYSDGEIKFRATTTSF